MPSKVKNLLRPGHRDPANRVKRACGHDKTGRGGCGQHDDHPRHVILLPDGSATILHMDCCNCISCVTQLDHAGEKRGLELAAHIQEHGDELKELVAAALDSQQVDEEPSDG